MKVHTEMCLSFCLRMIVHNEDNEDQDIKQLFQQVFKPFWVGVPVVRENFVIVVIIAFIKFS